jgi:hypothetical protein
MKLYIFIITIFLCWQSLPMKAQEEARKMILEDGTVVKMDAEGNVELGFSPDKQIESARITKEGEVTTTYSTAESLPKKTSTNTTLTLPGADFFSVDPKNLDDSSRASFINARKHYFAYFTEGYQHRQRVFHWQLLSSKIIFIVVVMLVFSGVVFAAIQFYAGLKSKVQSGAEVTTFEAGSSGLKVSSPVLGIIILAISLAFFYLYLVHIYPIEEIF